jgi:hypothetical protein
MRSCVPALLILVVLPLMNLMNLPAAPAPNASAILDIGPPPKGMTPEEHCKDVIERMTHPRGYIFFAGGGDPEMSKLPSLARLKDEFRPWMVKNIRVTQDGEHRLRVTFRAGNRAEQVVIINALLREYLKGVERQIKAVEFALREEEKIIAQNEKLIARGTEDRKSVEDYRKQNNNLRTNQLPARRAEIARLKQNTVIKWAK